MNPDAPLIVHVIWRLAIGGMENGLVNLINRMPVSQYRHAIICVTDATDFANRLQRDIEVVQLNREVDGQDPGLQLALWKQFRRLKPAIVHTRNAATIEASIAAKLAGVKSVVHSEHGWDASDPDGSNVKRQILRRLCKPFIKEFIALSSFQADYLRDKIRVPQRHLTELCNGVDTDRFMPQKADNTAARHSVLPAGFCQSDTVVIGTIGRHDPIKDTENLLRAFAALRDTDVDFATLRLVSVGDGPLTEHLAALADSLGIAKQTWFAGARNDIPAMLTSLDIFVLPSKSEGISNSILEAMACGLPVVATDVGGNAQLVCNGTTGTLVAANNSAALAAGILSLAKNGKQRQQFSNAAREAAVAHFSLAGMVQRYVQVYNRLV